MNLLRRTAVAMAAGLSAVTFLPSVTVQAAPAAESGALPITDTFTGEGTGRLNEALRLAENNAYAKASAAGYQRSDCENGKIDRTQRAVNDWLVRHNITCTRTPTEPPKPPVPPQPPQPPQPPRPPVPPQPPVPPRPPVPPQPPQPPRPPQGYELLVHSDTSLCFDAGRSANDIARLQTCNERNLGQRVIFNDTDGSLSVFGQCLEPQDRGRQDAVFLARCDNAARQQWEIVGNTSPYELRNIGDGRCLDIIDRNAGRNAQIGVYDCNTVFSTQNWYLSNGR